MTEEPLLSVCLITYNHVNYIEKAIDGVLAQKTNFKFKLIIADDYSLDGTRDILLRYKEKYPDIITLILQEKNVGPSKNWLDLITYPKSKYIAYFEGDDYWTDEFKLQNQVNFLESFHEYTFVCSNYDMFVEDLNLMMKSVLANESSSDLDIDIYKYLQKRNLIRTLTVVFRNDCFKNYLVEVDSSIVMNQYAGDVPLFLYLLIKGKGKYLNHVTAVYRLIKGSASRLIDPEKRFKFKRGIYEIISAYIKKFNLNKSVLKPTIIDGIVTDMEYYLYKGKYIHVFISLFKIILMGGRSKRAREIVKSIFDSKKKQEILTQI